LSSDRSGTSAAAASGLAAAEAGPADAGRRQNIEHRVGGVRACKSGGYERKRSPSDDNQRPVLAFKQAF